MRVKIFGCKRQEPAPHSACSFAGWLSRRTSKEIPPRKTFCRTFAGLLPCRTSDSGEEIQRSAMDDKENDETPAKGNEKEELEEILRKKSEECHREIAAYRQSYRESNEAKRECEPAWDGLLCWPPTPPGEEMQLPCPDYVLGFHSREKVYRDCTERGEWWIHPEQNSSWTNYSRCLNPHALDELGFIEGEGINSSLLKTWVPVIKRVSQVGYGISLSTLVIAFLILISFKRLHCPRNWLHLHLFASFILRASMAFGKDLFPRDFLSSDATYTGDQNTWECRLITTVWQYSLVANYTWILMEGLYLHNLIFMALVTDTSGILIYVLVGWGLPVLVVVPWAGMRAGLDDNSCWVINKNPDYFWIIRAPIVISIVVSFGLFLNISRVVLLKLRSSMQHERTNQHSYRRWAKSTLVLVPLFGVPYMILLGFSYSVGRESMEGMEVAWLFADQVFASSQVI
ncbi:unnamed protein product [Darwinula stevensoni]|uniref:Uncharacterized protein n=1 Tax=Darwinula stevensoni TaxID=69355 RepID=A0A7R8X9X1_9CRUS|nr:unnamed protein product [Darwinula stevensoni]CAG0883005.1 unnamed protein product [Darwinula stevensoni]